MGRAHNALVDSFSFQKFAVIGRSRQKSNLVNGSLSAHRNQMRTINTKYFVLIFTAAVALIIVVLSLLFFYEAFNLNLPADRLGAIKETYDLAVSKVLLSMFTTLVTAVLTYIFGKQLISAVADRIRSKAGGNS